VLPTEIAGPGGAREMLPVSSPELRVRRLLSKSRKTL
jgi:hypothetical protein